MITRHPSLWLSATALGLAGLLTATGGQVPAAPEGSIRNPYAQVDWATYRPYRASLHVHTSRSDGQASPRRVIHAYARMGFSVLALTDHDTMGPGRDRQHPRREKTTWPWTAFGVDPDALGMVAIEGNEISARHHIASYFCGYGDSAAASEQAILEAIGRQGGLAVFCHPGRYAYPAAWYADLFRNHPHAIGIEVYSNGDQYPQDRQKWDGILNELLPARTVWGFSSDDLHRLRHAGRNWNVLLLPELSAEAVRACLEGGAFFFAYSPQGQAGEPAPLVQSISVDESAGTITIDARDAGRIAWISGGEILQTGAVFQRANAPAGLKYIRAELRSPDGQTVLGTQPFPLTD